MSLSPLSHTLKSAENLTQNLPHSYQGVLQEFSLFRLQCSFCVVLFCSDREETALSTVRMCVMGEQVADF